MITVNIRPYDCCDRWRFYRDWLPGKTLAVHLVGKCKMNPTARNRAKYAIKHGYSVSERAWSEWNDHRDDIYQINTSAPVRQRNPMNQAYFDYPDMKIIDNPCTHKYLLVAVDLGGKWVAYAILHAMHELMNISTIIGHTDYWKDGIMPVLLSGIIETAERHGVKVIDYGTWDSGTDGLRYFKHSGGFFPAKVNEIG